MRKNRIKPASLQLAENNQNKVSRDARILLTRIPAYVNVCNVENVNGSGPVKKRYESGLFYNLRFDSKAQKKRLENAAAVSHKTLREFLLDLGEQMALQLKEAKAS